MYAGPGVFTLQMDDQNRNGGVLNIPNSVARESFCIRTQLVISRADRSQLFGALPELTAAGRLLPAALDPQLGGLRPRWRQPEL